MQALNDLTEIQAPVPISYPAAVADKIVRKMHAGSIVGLSTTRLESLVREGKFPAPFKLCEGGRASGWLRSTLDQWIAARHNAAAADHLSQQGKAIK